MHLMVGLMLLIQTCVPMCSYKKFSHPQSTPARLFYEYQFGLHTAGLDLREESCVEKTAIPEVQTFKDIVRISDSPTQVANPQSTQLVSLVDPSHHGQHFPPLCSRPSHRFHHDLCCSSATLSPCCRTQGMLRPLVAGHSRPLTVTWCTGTRAM